MLIHGGELPGMSVRRPESLSRVAGRERVRRTCGEMMTWFVLLRLVPLKLVVSSLQPGEVGLFSGTGCMVPQLFSLEETDRI
jgi:hypothetical protein